MKRTYIVVRGARSHCGMHPGSVSWRSCPHCDRARALTEAALENVVPRQAVRTLGRLTDDDVVRIRELAAMGIGPCEIETRTGYPHRSVRAVLAGRSHVISIAERRKQAGLEMSRHIVESPAARMHRQAIVPNRERA